MGKEKYIKDVENLFIKSPVVNFSSIARIIKNRKGTSQYAKQLLKNLVLKGRIRKLTKGYYTLYEEPSLAVFCFQPAYLGLQDALSIHNLWEQETVPVIITGRKIRPGIRKIFGMNVLIRRIDKKYLLGIEYYKQGDFYFPCSDIEKTFIDLIYFNENLNREVIKNIIKKINRKKLLSYLKKYPVKIKKKILRNLSG